MGSALAGGAPRVPKPSRVRQGGSAVAGLAADPAGAAGAAPASATIRLSISTNRPEIGRFDQVMSADMKQHDQTFAAALGGHQRSSVSEPRPGLGGQPWFGLGQHLPRNRDLLR